MQSTTDNFELATTRKMMGCHSKGEIVPPGGSSGKKFVLKVLMHQTPPIGMY